MNIYVGNLSFEVTEDDVRGAFGAFGQVASVSLITDKFTGKSRGFGFVEMANGEEAKAAIAGLNGKDLKGRALNINEARPKTEGGGGGDRPRGGGGGGRRGGGGGGGRRREREGGGGYSGPRF